MICSCIDISYDILDFLFVLKFPSIDGNFNVFVQFSLLNGFSQFASRILSMVCQIPLYVLGSEILLLKVSAVRHGILFDKYHSSVIFYFSLVIFSVFLWQFFGYYVLEVSVIFLVFKEDMHKELFFTVTLFKIFLKLDLVESVYYIALLFPKVFFFCCKLIR